ncbi:tyrosine-type recombinase/integrase [Candidatus Falkowbacteria bacterium]|nr:tyrosine-type recombinase/integrase [Candidatus Falkowbacteria bacterium]
MDKKINKLIDDFLLHLKLARKSEMTVRNYEFYLRRFLKFSHNPPSEKINLVMIDKYREWLSKLPEKNPQLFPKEKVMKANTKNYHLIAIRSFLKYLRRRGINVLRPEKIKLETVPKQTREFLSESEMERILEAPLETEAEEIIKYRDKAILEVLLATALRVGELASLKKGDIRQEGVWVLGKNEVKRRVVLGNQAKHWIKKYLEKRKDKTPALFVGHDRAAKKRRVKQYIPKNNLTSRSIQRIVAKYGKMAGIGKKITPQVIRNSLANQMIRQGMGKKEVAGVMGYESLVSVKRYE